jgi:hypothetical protein
MGPLQQPDLARSGTWTSASKDSLFTDLRFFTNFVDKIVSKDIDQDQSV